MSGVFLTDFGLAKNTVTGSKYTRTGETLGTPAYMSPEQARGDLSDLTPASDVWALGCVLYELLANRKAFEGDTPAAVIGHVMTGEPPSLRTVCPDLPSGTRQLIEACLWKTPAGRPSRGRALRDDLERLLAAQLPKHRPPPRRMPWLIAAGVVLLTGLGTTVALWPSAPPAAVVDPVAIRLAKQGWELRRDDPRGGAELLEKALQLEHGRHDWRLRRGLLLWASGQADSAGRLWGAIPPETRFWPQAQLFLALELHFRLLGKPAWPPADERRLRTLVASLVGREDMVGRYARSLDRILEREATAALNELVGVGGWEAALLRALANTDPEIKIREYSVALEQGVRFGWALSNRGAAREHTGDLSGALDDFDAALTVTPRDMIALANRGAVKARLGRHTDAIRDFDTALSIDPENADVLFWRGRTKLVLNELADAITDLDQALEIDPRYLKALIARGLAKNRLRDHASAIDDYTAAIAVDPRSVIGFYNRGVAREQSGDLAGAVADYSAALALAPSHRDALYNRGRIRLRQKDYRSALADLDAALAVDPRDPSLLANRGIAHFRLQNNEAAVSDFKAALDAAPPGWPHRSQVEGLRRDCTARIRAHRGKK